MIVSDNGTEPGAGVVGVKWHYIVLGTPTQNGSSRVYTIAYATISSTKRVLPGLSGALDAGGVGKIL